MNDTSFNYEEAAALLAAAAAILAAPAGKSPLAGESRPLLESAVRKLAALAGQLRAALPSDLSRGKVSLMTERTARLDLTDNELSLLYQMLHDRQQESDQEIEPEHSSHAFRRRLLDRLGNAIGAVRRDPLDPAPLPPGEIAVPPDRYPFVPGLCLFSGGPRHMAEIAIEKPWVVFLTPADDVAIRTIPGPGDPVTPGTWHRHEYFWDDASGVMRYQGCSQYPSVYPIPEREK